MTLKDLVFKLEEEVVIKRLLELYPGQDKNQEGYKKLYKN